MKFQHLLTVEEHTTWLKILKWKKKKIDKQNMTSTNHRLTRTVCSRCPDTKDEEPKHEQDRPISCRTVLYSRQNKLKHFKVMGCSITGNF